MVQDLAEVAKGTVIFLTPFMPYLTPIGKGIQKKLEDVIAEKGGNIVWDQAQKLWNRIKLHFKDDPVVTSAATMLSDAPELSARQQMFEQVLAERLKADPALAQELLSILGGPTRLQEVIGGHKSQITEIYQEMSGPGEQRVEGGDETVIKGVDQVQNS